MTAHPFLLPCVELMLLDGEGEVRAGVLGRVRPDMADAFHARKAIWLAELDHRLGLGGSLQGGHEAPASGWKRFWK